MAKTGTNGKALNELKIGGPRQRSATGPNEDDSHAGRGPEIREL